MNKWSWLAVNLAGTAVALYAHAQIRKLEEQEFINRLHVRKF